LRNQAIRRAAAAAMLTHPAVVPAQALIPDLAIGRSYYLCSSAHKVHEQNRRFDGTHAGRTASIKSTL